MAQVQKGVVTYTVDGKAAVKQSGNNAVTPLIDLKDTGATTNDVVAFVLFEDGTGFVLAKM